MTKTFKYALAILCTFILVKLILLPLETSLWWDGAVYVGMAKMVYSGTGLWEIVRPLLWPVMMGASIPLGIDTVLFGRVLEFLASIGIVWLTFLLAQKTTKDDRIALASMTILAFSFIFFFWSYKLYTSIPATLFMLLAYYCMSKKQPLLSGIFSAVSVLTRFPLGMFIIPLEWFVIKQKTVKEKVLFLLKYNIPLALGLGGLLYFNYRWYGDMFQPFSQMIASTGWGSAPILFPNTGIFMYLLTLLVTFTILLPFIIPGVKKLWKKKETPIFVLTPFIIGIVVFHLLSIKEERFLIPVLPFAAIIIAYGLYSTRFKKWSKTLLITYAIIGIVIVASVSSSITAFKGTASEEFYFGDGQLEDCPHDARIAASSPVPVGVYDDVLPYYGSWTNDRLTEEIESITCVFISTCDFSGELAPIIEERFILGYNDSSGYCKFYGYHKTIFKE